MLMPLTFTLLPTVLTAFGGVGGVVVSRGEKINQALSQFMSQVPMKGDEVQLLSIAHSKEERRGVV